MHLRNFQESDTATVCRLVSSALDEAYDPEVFDVVPKAWPQASIVAETLSGISGFLMGMMTAPGKAQILMLAVDPDQRHRGTGSALMLKFLTVCAAAGCQSVELEVRKSNINAIRFYQRFGFELRDLKENYYHDGEDALVMVIEES